MQIYPRQTRCCEAPAGMGAPASGSALNIRLCYESMLASVRVEGGEGAPNMQTA